MNTDTRIREKIGGIAIHKGKAKGAETSIIMWDAIPRCDPDTCPISDHCPYNKNGRCTLRVNYQKHIVDSVLGSLPEISEAQMLHIGMHLMPLYTQLVQMKIVALDAEPMVVARGSTVPNPVFKEIRAIIREICSCLKEIGVHANAVLAGGNIPTKPNDGRGDRSYYDGLMELDS